MSRPSDIAAWVREHQRAAGIGLVGAAVILLGVAVAIGYSLYSGFSAGTGQPGASANHSARASQSGSASVVPSTVLASSAPSVTGAPSVSPVVFTGFQFYDILRVEVTGLAVRVEPARSSPLMHGYRVQSDPEDLGEVRLNPGDLVNVWLGPLTIGDTVWYLVQPGPDAAGNYSGDILWRSSSDSLAPTSGWVAASVGQDQYMALERRPDPSEYESWSNIPGGPHTLTASGKGNYDSGPQIRHDMYAFTWAVAVDSAPPPCAFAVRLLPDDGSDPVIGIDRSTAAFNQGPMEGLGSVLNTPWPGSAGGTTETFTVSIRSGCTWTIGLQPLAHD
jgi:hypothetical protein